MSRYFKDFAYNHLFDSKAVLCARIREDIEKYYSGTSYREMGEEIHVSGSTISNVMNDNHDRLSLVMLSLLCIRLGLDHRV